MEEFLQKENISSTPLKKISNHLWLQCVLNGNQFEKDWRWSLHIVVDEMTTAAELRGAWGKIDNAREELPKLWQGTDSNWYSVALMLDLEEKKKDTSYGELAMDMNFDTLVYLLWTLDESKKKEFTKVGQITFVNHLQGLGIKKKTIQELEASGKADLANCDLIWKLKSKPISSQRIVDALRQFKIEKSSNKIVIAQSASTNRLYKLRISALVGTYWMQAKDLVQRWDPKGFKSYEKRWNARTSELIYKSHEFSGLNPQ